ncbi:Protein of unknown function [Lachnospiraceae bacterium C7]|nr:Protein of unknown function [Lachnospiraceae bacterium C7]
MNISFMYKVNLPQKQPNRNSTNAKYITSAVFMAVGIIFLVSTIFFGLENLYQNKHCTVQVDATIERWVPITSHSSSSKHSSTTTSYHGVYRYEYKGITYTEQSRVGFSSPQTRPEEKATIHINPNDPTQFYSDVSNENHMLMIFSIIFGGMGALFFIIGVVIFPKNKKKQFL